MQRKTKELIKKIGIPLRNLKQPINLIAVCSGGSVVAKIIHSYLKQQGIESYYFEVWTNTMKGKRTIWKTDFKKRNYRGSAVIVEDVIWTGGSIPPIKRMLRKLNPHKRPFVISLLDCNRKADFSVFQ